MKPLVSVVIPTFNRESLLVRALKSVLAQTYPNWECLVVDDASTDNTEGVVRSFDDTRIQYLRHETNRGGSAARNTGIHAAKGEYLAFLDSDDEWLPQKLEQQIKVFEAQNDPQLGAVLCGRILVTPEDQRFFPGPILGEDPYLTVLTAGLEGLGTSGVIIHNRVIKAGIHFDESFPACQDRDFMVQLTSRFRVQTVSEPLIRQHRGHGDVHLWNGSNAARGLEKLINKYSAELRQRPSDLARLHVAAGIKFLVAGELSDGRGHIISAWKYQPGSYAVYGWLIISVLGSKAAKWWVHVRS